MGTVTCISGIDTDIGKTVATGLLAKALGAQKRTVVTQKIAQTGCAGIAEDIVQHRQLMGIDLIPEDISGVTCSFVFEKACSPHLAAELSGSHIDPAVITAATRQLAAEYEHVLLEGAGGLMVPLNRRVTFLDYIEEQGYPLILVTSPRLGSINHTLSALELAKERGIAVKGLVYNRYDVSDTIICEDSRQLFIRQLQKYSFSDVLVDMEDVSYYQKNEIEFDCLRLFDVKRS